MNFAAPLFYFVIFFVASPTALAFENTCESWFLKSGVKAGTQDCELDCALLPSGMGTFDCSTRCEGFCKTYLKPDTMSEIAKYIEPRALTPSERSLIAKYPLAAIRVYRTKRDATNSTKRLFGRNFRNDESDAYRHFMWSGLIREKIDKDRVEAFLNAHEANNSEPDAEGKMDKSNNAKGIAIAEKLIGEGNFSQQRLEQEAIKAIKGGNLNVLSPTGKVPEWKK
jgi:hypothetical protein